MSAIYANSIPKISDSEQTLLIKILQSANVANTAYGVTVSNPAFGTTQPRISDSRQTLLIKIGEAMNTLAGAVSGGSSGSYAAGGNFSGTGSPEGVVTANKGAHYVDLNTPDRLWNKTTDGTNTGWTF